jgi:hypothetical protein
MNIWLLSGISSFFFSTFKFKEVSAEWQSKRYRKNQLERSLLIIILLSLTACGADEGTNPPPDTRIRISGLLDLPGDGQAVANKAIKLLRINNDGDIVGDVLDTATSDQSGNYVLILPDGIGLSSNLIVSADIGNNETARAIVIDENTDITPITEYITAKLIEDPDLDLNNLPASEVTKLVTFVESLNLTPQANFADTLAQIETTSEIEIETRVVLLTNPGIKLSGLLAVPGPAARNQSVLLRPVPNATINLYRINDDGTLNGASLASTPTDEFGNYELVLPDGMLLESNLVLRAEVADGVFLNALAVSQELNINATSEYIFTQIIESPDLLLSSLTIGSIFGLVEYVEDLNLSDGADLDATLLAIDNAASSAIESQLRDIQILSASSNPGVFGSTNWGNSVFQ